MPSPARRPRPLRWVPALVIVLTLVGCGGVTAVTLEDLAFDTEAHEGEEVRTVGRVVEFSEADGALERHLVIEDATQNRVRLLPIDDAEPYIGAFVEVTGTFVFDPARGRTLELTEIGEARAGS